MKNKKLVKKILSAFTISAFVIGVMTPCYKPVNASSNSDTYSALALAIMASNGNINGIDLGMIPRKISKYVSYTYTSPENARVQVDCSAANKASRIPTEGDEGTYTCIARPLSSNIIISTVTQTRNVTFKKAGKTQVVTFSFPYQTAKINKDKGEKIEQNASNNESGVPQTIDVTLKIKVANNTATTLTEGVDATDSSLMNVDINGTNTSMGGTTTQNPNGSISITTCSDGTLFCPHETNPDPTDIIIDTAPGPTNTDPTNTDPTNTDPTNTDPTNTDPTNTDPTNTDPTNTDPTNTDPTNTDPTNTDPTNTDPTNTDPTNTDPTNTDPTNTDPTNTDPTIDPNDNGGLKDKPSDQQQIIKDNPFNNNNNDNYKNILDDLLDYSNKNTDPYNSSDTDWANSNGGNSTGDGNLDDWFSGIPEEENVPTDMTTDDTGVDDVLTNNTGTYQDGNSQDDGYTTNPEYQDVVLDYNGENSDSDGGFSSSLPMKDLEEAFQNGLDSLSGNNDYELNGDNANLLGSMDASADNSSLGDKLKMLLGDTNANTKRGTASDQELYDIAKKWLLANGFTMADIRNGKNYDANSAYTEPTVAWDMNRITTLLKGRKISLTSPTEIKKDNKSKSTLSKSVSDNKK